MIKPKYILIMKAGPYCGYSLDEIINIKSREEKNIGKFFWGYSGVFCRPNVLQNFVSMALANNEKVKVLFVETKSSFTTNTVDRFEKYSKDKNIWSDLPKEVLLVGNKNKPHFAITANNLKVEELELDLGEYGSIKGMFINEEKRLDKYFKYRVDKACGYFLGKKANESKVVNVKYSADLVSPFSLYIK